jgi:8-oxo-dGTP diphosphatase
MLKKYYEFISEEYSFEDKETGVIALFNPKNELLALKRGSTAPWMPNCWNLTGGIIGDVNNSETPKQAVIREVEEETGLSPKMIKYFGSVNTSKSKYDCGIIHYFTGIIDSDPISSDNENSEYKFIRKSDMNKIDWVPFLVDFTDCDLSNCRFKKSFLDEIWS